MPAVVEALAAGADHERAAVNPHHHGPLAAIAGRRPDVQVEAVFGLLTQGAAEQRLNLCRRLRADGPETRGIPHAGPGGRPFRGAPAQRPDRRFCVRNALEGEEVALPQTGEPTAGRLDDNIFHFAGGAIHRISFGVGKLANLYDRRNAERFVYRFSTFVRL